MLYAFIITAGILVVWILIKFGEAIKEAPSIRDKRLLEIYMQGFDDELSGTKNDKVYEGLEARAYSLGKIDAIVGDDVRSVDYQSDETTLHQIYNA